MSQSSQEEPQKSPKIPELELVVVLRALRNHGVFQDQVKDKPYYIRFKQLDSERNIQGFTHAKGTKISPRFLLQVLERFDIKLPDFLESVTAVKKGPQPV